MSLLFHKLVKDILRTKDERRAVFHHQQTDTTNRNETIFFLPSFFSELTYTLL